MPTITKTKRGFKVEHTTREVWGVDDPSDGHTLKVLSLHDAAAECSCGGWVYACTGEQTRRHIEEEHERHIENHVTVLPPRR